MLHADTHLLPDFIFRIPHSNGSLTPRPPYCKRQKQKNNWVKVTRFSEVSQVQLTPGLLSVTRLTSYMICTDSAKSKCGTPHPNRIQNFKRAEWETQLRAPGDCLGHTPKKLVLVVSHPPRATTMLDACRLRAAVLWGQRGGAVFCEVAGVCLDPEVRRGYQGGPHARDEGRRVDHPWAQGRMKKPSCLKDRTESPD